LVIYQETKTGPVMMRKETNPTDIRIYFSVSNEFMSALKM